MPLIPKAKENPESGPTSLRKPFIINNLAERVGFEPTLPFRVNTLSKRAPSATRPSLRRQVGKQLRRTNFSRRTRLHLLIDSMGEVAEPQLEAAYVTAALWKALCPEPAR